MKKLILIMTAIASSFATTLSASDDTPIVYQESDSVTYPDDDSTICANGFSNNRYNNSSAVVSGTRSGINPTWIGAGVVAATAAASIIAVTNSSSSSHN